IIIAFCSSKPVSVEAETSECLNKLVGHWEGSFKLPTIWVGNPDRTLELFAVNNVLKARYGTTGRRLVPINVSADLIDDVHCNPIIRFSTPYNLRVTLRLMRDDWLEGEMIQATDGIRAPFQLFKKY